MKWKKRADFSFKNILDPPTYVSTRRHNSETKNKQSNDMYQLKHYGTQCKAWR
jgi:hypothetical protein